MECCHKLTGSPSQRRCHAWQRSGRCQSNAEATRRRSMPKGLRLTGREHSWSRPDPPAQATLAWFWLVVAMVGALVACGGGPNADAEAFSCSVQADRRYPTDLLQGPDLSRDAFLDTEAGQAMHVYFTTEPGAREAEEYWLANGFTIVSRHLVLGYEHEHPFVEFEMLGGEIGAGTCSPTLRSGDLTAYEWSLPSTPATDTTIVAATVAGSGCVRDDGSIHAVSQVESIEVMEFADRVEVTVWGLEAEPLLTCSDIDFSMPIGIALSDPLGSRALIDTGRIPAVKVTPAR